MNTLAVIAGLVIALWIAYRYEAIGTVGGAGVAIAALPFLQHRASFLDLIVLSLAGSAFTIGMVLGPKRADKRFHWSALVVNALPWIAPPFVALYYWSGWRDTSSAPTILVAAGTLALITLGGLGVWWLSSRFQRKLSP